jgi:hypothetical protein
MRYFEKKQKDIIYKVKNGEGELVSPGGSVLENNNRFGLD